MYRFNVSELDDLKSQLLLIHTGLSNNIQKSKLSDALALECIRPITLLNIGAKCLGYTQFSGLKKAADYRFQYRGRVDLLSLMDVSRFKSVIKEMTAGMPDRALDEAIGLVASSPQVEYPFITELCSFTGGMLCEGASDLQRPVIEDYGRTPEEMDRFLVNASNFDLLARTNRFYIKSHGESVQLITGEFLSKEELERQIYENIFKIRAGILSGRFKYLPGLIRRQECSGNADNQVVDWDSEDGIPRRHLVGYCCIHNETPRGLFSGRHLKQLRYLAGSIGMPLVEMLDDEFVSDKDQVGTMIQSARRIEGYFQALQ